MGVYRLLDYGWCRGRAPHPVMRCVLVRHNGRKAGCSALPMGVCRRCWQVRAVTGQRSKARGEIRNGEVRRANSVIRRLDHFNIGRLEVHLARVTARLTIQSDLRRSRSVCETSCPSTLNAHAAHRLVLKGCGNAFRPRLLQSSHCVQGVLTRSSSTRPS
jgi:hypothetical protein